VRAPESVDPYGMIATGSSLVNGAAGDVLCVLLLERRGYTRAQFGVTHPGGAVGERLMQEEHR
jgi:arabinose-5-phosphate isomerase